MSCGGVLPLPPPVGTGLGQSAAVSAVDYANGTSSETARRVTRQSVKNTASLDVLEKSCRRAAAVDSDEEDSGGSPSPRRDPSPDRAQASTSPARPTPPPAGFAVLADIARATQDFEAILRRSDAREKELLAEIRELRHTSSKEEEEARSRVQAAEAKAQESELLAAKLQEDLLEAEGRLTQQRQCTRTAVEVADALMAAAGFEGSTRLASEESTTDWTGLVSEMERLVPSFSSFVSRKVSRDSLSTAATAVSHTLARVELWSRTPVPKDILTRRASGAEGKELKKGTSSWFGAASEYVSKMFKGAPAPVPDVPPAQAR
ncbi:hypothetical protein ZWY2020_025436 [Hordeum vulgare]|nr:hypothetical protein ZWY2020_025436 [Hordeum vulgare]